MKDIYKNKALCACGGCEMANNCIRQIAFREADETDKHLMVINPKLVTQNADCEYFAHLEVIRYARGFKNVFANVPMGAANIIYHKLMTHFGKNQYYDRRNGKLLLPPGEQEYIATVFAEYGITSDIFDSYEDKEAWVEG